MVNEEKEWSKLLIVNGIFCSIGFHILWGNWYTNYDKKHYKRWNFNWENQAYGILITKTSNDFSLYEKYESSSTEINSGEYFMKGDSLILIDDREEVTTKQRIVIYKDELYGFNKVKHSIKLDKLD